MNHGETKGTKKRRKTSCPSFLRGSFPSFQGDFSFITIKLAIQALEELSVFITDFSQALFDRDLFECRRLVFAFGLFIFEGDSGFENEEDIVPRGADAFERLIDFI